jgi:membrane fusion protein (multidrug efflux system)
MDLNDANVNPESPKKRLKPFQWIVLVVIVVLAFVYAIPKLHYSRTHTSTDNAYLTADISQIAPQVMGTVKEVLVEQNQLVKAGDVLVILDDTRYRIAVDQAKATLDAAIADARGAGINVDLTRNTASSQITQAEGVVDQSKGSVGSARADYERAKASFQAAKSSEAKAFADVQSSRSDVEIASLGIERAQEALSSAEAQLGSSRANLSALQSTVATASAKVQQAQRDADRIRTLAESGAVSKQQLENAELTLDTAKSQLDGQREQVEAARSLVAQREAEKSAAQKQIQIAKATKAQAQTRLRSMAEVAQSAASQTKAGIAQQKSAQEVIQQSRGRVKQSFGQLDQAKTASLQVSSREAARKLALAKVDQARASLDAAELDLQRTRIVAPVDGRVSKKTVVVGNLVQVGTLMMAIVSESTCTIAANFKETQINSLRKGQVVEIEVDGIPSHRYRGHVDSVAGATGATFALLPPDNATGNFVKVIQRVPVRITFDPDQPGLEDLRAGLSAYVAVKTN